MNRRKAQNLVFVVAMLWTAMVLGVAFAVMQGCATVKHVVRTVDDVATLACELFGQRNPDEFAYLVKKVSPPNAVAVTKSGFNVKELCAVKEVLQPFIDEQLRLQHETAASLRMGMENPSADHPQ